MKRIYSCLPIDSFCEEGRKIVPIRDLDKYEIMKWRNDQIDVLRQKEPLTQESQERYFKDVVAPLFQQSQPGQLLFSYLINDQLVGYGGLVHIDWESRHAEISFLTPVDRALNHDTFVADWVNFLNLLKQPARKLRFIKIYTYSYDVRPWLYEALTKSQFVEEARLHNHVSIQGVPRDILIHSFQLSEIYVRKATEADVQVYFDWANDPIVRQSSYVTQEIDWVDHVKWFERKIVDPSVELYIFFELKSKEPVGQVRIESKAEETVIGVSVDSKFRGLGFGGKMIRQACDYFLMQNSLKVITAYIKKENRSSYQSFINAGFLNNKEGLVKGIESYVLIKKL